MPGEKTFDLQSAYSDLNKACSCQAYEKVINLSGKILTKYPTEFKAFKCKVVALIRAEKYEDCLSFLKKNSALISHVIFEKAYVEYRLNRLTEAAKTLESIDPDNFKAQELKAQVLYRKGDFVDSYACLRTVIRNSRDDYNEERLTNLTAVAAAESCFSNNSLDLDVNPQMYEGKFNLACYHLGRGDCQLASELLGDAENTCNLSLSEDPEITEEEKNEELAPIRVQQAYILQLSKRDEEANQVYQSVIRQRASDPALLAVAANNIVCINQDQNIFDSRKRIKMTSTDGLQFKLFSRQRIDMLINQALFYWYTNQMEACRAKLRAVLQDELNPRALLLSAAQLIKEKNVDKAVLLLESYLSNATEGHIDVEIPLALAQLSLRRISTTQLGHGIPQPKHALSVAQMLEDFLPKHLIHSPGVLSTRIALYLLASSGENAVQTRDDSMKKIVSCIESTLHYYEESGEQNEVYSHLLDHCATFLLQQGEAKLAAELLEKQLARLESENWHVKQKNLITQVLVARLVRAYAQFNRPKAEQACKSLQPKDSLSEVDVDTLETTFLYGAKSLKRLGRPNEQAIISDSIRSKRDQHKKSILETPSENPLPQQVTSRSKRKKRKVRLPKDYQPGVMPDPDRWLPRRERVHYRGKRRDKRFAPTRGPQGQITGGSEWDAAARSPKVTVHEDGSGGSTPKQVSGAAKQQQKKSRKKGR
ncbi:hypothetical protein MN116_003058 [Schistosoma mekongi]|uniref:Signal recognition particle subunit SRP72 n=1 Tax=Schistosoma mekongi TaxID=38744 RepID=A0AAE1ZHY7_SCHME|nr:hypothetical protein MN116_003058 [Schistosoma mekongi]